MLYEMKPQYSPRRSFHGKAMIEDDGASKTLISYDTPVAKFSHGQLTLMEDWAVSSTTRRHVAEFSKQMGVFEQFSSMAKAFGKSRHLSARS